MQDISAMEDAAARRWREWEQIEQAYNLALRCARLALRLHAFDLRLADLQSWWRAVDIARLTPDSSLARARYLEVKEQADPLRAEWRTNWDMLRRLQENWTADDWARYQSYLAEQPVTGEGALTEQIIRQTLRRSAQPASSLSSRLRVWWRRLGGNSRPA